MIRTDTANLDTLVPKTWASIGYPAKIAGRVFAVLYKWQRRASTRHHLITLDGRMLNDIGLSRADAEREGRKNFWHP